jgi:methionyl-tRNA formyltransferase
MRIVCLCNNWVGWQVLKWLAEREEQIVGLIVHPPGRQKCGDEILSSVCLSDDQIFYGDKLRHEDTLRRIEALQPDIALSIFFGYILRPAFLDIPPKGCINLHPAFLPYNRGAYPNVWSIIEGTPAGVTLHYIDEGVDTGDIIARRQVAVLPTDTGERLYRRLERACVELFQEYWPLISSSQAPRIAQNKNEGTLHRAKDIEQIDALDVERSYTARQLIDILRARTFPPYRGAYFEHDGRRVYLRLQLLYEEELAKGE